MNTGHVEVDPTLNSAGDAQAPLPNGHRPALCAARLQPVLRQVEADLDQPLRVSDMASAVGLSLFHFSREFRRVTGVSPYAYIRRRRIARSCLLLAGSKLAIVEIARVVGFKTHAHFSGAFLKTVGVTPRTYRLRHGPKARLEMPAAARIPEAAASHEAVLALR
jgi:AraC-like DNA-binding protein